MNVPTKRFPGLASWHLLSIAGEARLDVRTVVNVLRDGSRENTRQQVIDAAARLGIALPARLGAPPDLDGSNGARVRAT
jgi:hypothetical protein